MKFFRSIVRIVHRIFIVIFDHFIIGFFLLIRLISLAFSVSCDDCDEDTQNGSDEILSLPIFRFSSSYLITLTH